MILTRILLVGLTLACSSKALYGQWIATNGPMEGIALSLAVDTGSVGQANLFVGAWEGRVFQSSDSGDTWREIDGGNWMGFLDTGFTRKDIGLLATYRNPSHGSFLFALDASRTLFRSVEGDTNWTALQIGQTHRGFNTLLVMDTIVIGGTDSGLVVSMDVGAHWDSPQNDLTPFRVNSLLFVGYAGESGSLFAATNGGVYRSSTMGSTWEVVNSEALEFASLRLMREPSGQTALYALRSSMGDIFCSTDSGTSWSAVNDLLDQSTRISFGEFAIRDTIIYASGSTYQPRMFYSLDRGKRWIGGDLGLGGRPVRSLMSDGRFLYAATASDIGHVNSVWRRPLSEMVTATGIAREPGLSRFNLHQNYPNPFNPITAIVYELSDQAEVLLKVFDVLGREIVTLVDERQSAGIHSVYWDASDRSSGIYFCRLASGGQTQTRKMTLLK